MVAINHSKSSYNFEVYSDFAIKTWTHYCERHNIDFKVITEHDERYGFPIWNKVDIIDQIDNYDKFGIVDCDTMVKWDAPNIFDEIESGVSGVLDLANMRWVYDSCFNYGKFFDIDIDYYKYINAGVIFCDKKGLKVYEDLRNFYFENQQELDSWNNGGGKEQTLFNYHLQKGDYDINLIPPIWNLFSMHKTEMFSHNWQYGDNITPFFMKYGYVWHFTGFPIEQRETLMKQTWERTMVYYYD